MSLRIAAVVLALLGLIAGSVALYNSDTFAIDEVRIEGISELTAEEVVAVAALPEGATLVRFPRGELESRLLAHPWISSVHISRRFPSTLIIHVEERTPVALVDTGEAAFWLVDNEGTMLGQRTPDATESAGAVVRDLTDFEPVEGERSQSSALMNSLRVIEGLSDELRGQVRAVSAPSVDLTTLITVDDVEILVGSAEEIEKKDAVARRIIEEHADTVVHINVRTVDRPTWRGLESAQ